MFLPIKSAAAIFLERPGGFVVHFEQDTVSIADGDRPRKFLDPFVIAHITPFVDTGSSEAGWP